jgi:O-acetyl-ADP-ribose deacetylase (regulator of RNase III)
MTGLSTRLDAIEADITTLQLDAIVNAANSALMPGGGVDGAIRRKAGREMDEDLYGIGHCAEGEAVITCGYRLPASRVIHTVAPVWAGGAEQEATLVRCYDSVLTLDTSSAPSLFPPSARAPMAGRGIWQRKSPSKA